MITISGGYLAATVPYTSVNAWLNSGLITANPSSGGIALTTSLGENINLATPAREATRALMGIFPGLVGTNTIAVS